MDAITAKMAGVAIQTPEHIPAGPPDAPQQQPLPTTLPPSSAASTPSASLYVGELENSITEAQLYEIFNMIGPVGRYEQTVRLRKILPY